MKHTQGLILLVSYALTVVTLGGNCPRFVVFPVVEQFDEAPV